MKNYVLCMTLIFSGFYGFSQENIHIEKDERIDELSKVYAEMRSMVKEKKGYRLQLLSTSNQASINQMENDFKDKYEFKTYITYKSPNFKLRVGDFEDKLEAYRFLQEIKHKYSNSFIVEDIINVHLD